MKGYIRRITYFLACKAPSHIPIQFGRLLVQESASNSEFWKAPVILANKIKIQDYIRKNEEIEKRMLIVKPSPLADLHW